jgi:hypothetical protein
VCRTFAPLVEPLAQPTDRRFGELLTAQFVGDALDLAGGHAVDGHLIIASTSAF